MPRLHRILLAAPVLLSLACTVELGGSTTSTTTTSDGTTTDEPSPTTTNDPSVPTTTEPDATTTDATTTSDATTTPDGTTGPGEVACMITGECAEDEFCVAPYDVRAEMMGTFACQSECVADKGQGNSADVWCADDASCCGDGNTCDDMGYCVPGPVETTTGETDTSGTDSSGTDSSGTETDTENSGSSGSTGDTDTDGGLLPLISLDGLEVTANCQPAVPPDPIGAQWTAIFDNKNGMAEITAELTAASLVFYPDNDEFVQGITVDPTSSGVVAAGKSVMVAMSKTKANVDLPMDCGQCGKPVSIELVFDVDGQDITALAEATLECVF